jgi:peptide/nickel transport system substrate-binding protein
VVLPSKVEAINASTVKLTLAKPYPALLQDLTTIELGTALSRTAHAKADDPYGYETGAATKPITAGAFKVDEFTSKQSMALSRFDAYWGGAAYLDRITARPVPEDGTRITLLKTGEADIVSNVPPQDIKDLESDNNIVLDSRPGQKVLNIIVNMLKPPFGPGPDAKATAFRQAVAYAIDRESIIKNILRGQGAVANSPMIPSQFGYKEAKSFSFDPEQSKKLLAQAGWDKGYKPKLFVGEGFATAAKEVAQAVQAMLREVGMDVELEVWGDYGAMVTTVLSKQPDQYAKWDLNFNSWSMLPEPSSRISQILHGGTGLVSYNGADMDALLDKQLFEVDDAKRAATLGEVQDLAMKALPYIPMYYQYYSHAWKKNLKGVRVQDSESFDLRKAWLS